MTREEAIVELNVIWERLSHPEDCENGCYSFRDGNYLEALDMAIEALQTEPPTGSWISEIDTGTWMLECSVCKCSIESHGSIAYKFCPMCGADMRGEKE